MMMTSRERVLTTINHEEPDRVTNFNDVNIASQFFQKRTHQ